MISWQGIGIVWKALTGREHLWIMKLLKGWFATGREKTLVQPNQKMPMLWPGPQLSKFWRNTTTNIISQS